MHPQERRFSEIRGSLYRITARDQPVSKQRDSKQRAYHQLPVASIHPSAFSIREIANTDPRCFPNCDSTCRLTCLGASFDVGLPADRWTKNSIAAAIGESYQRMSLDRAQRALVIFLE